MNWLDTNHFPEGNVESGIDLANQLYWNLRVVQEQNMWHVLSGEKEILLTDNEEVLRAFLYGLGIAYGILPEYIFELLRREIIKIAE
jgi:hypothetical protein